MTSFPPNFIPIVDAFVQAVDALAPVDGPARDLNDLSKAELDEFEHEFVEFSQRKNEAERKVEGLFRDALAGGLLDPWVNGRQGMEMLSDREDWRPKAFGAPGFELRPAPFSS
jgi:hypothetical protein